MFEITTERLPSGEWIAYRDGEFPDREAEGWQRNGYGITGRGKTEADAEADYIDRHNDWHDEP